jgi:Tol biopolymer transport system component
VDLGYLGSPRWSPDGDYIVVTGRDAKGRQGIFRVDPQSGDAQLLVGGASRYMAGWSADARSIVYRIQDRPGQTIALVRQPLDGGASTDLFRVSGRRFTSLSHADVSPDGRQVVFTFERDSGQATTLQVVSTDGGETRQIYQSPPDFDITDVVWSGDGRYILFVESRRGRNERGIVVPDRKKTRLMRLPAAGGAAEETGVVMDNIQYLRPHPDGQRIGFTAGLQTNEVWAMENFLPKPLTPPTPGKR